MKILVALSGGIDSSTVAHMLAAEGHKLIGVRFTLWSDPLAPALAQILPSKCCNLETATRGAATAKTLGIPYHIVNLEKEFKREVVDPYLADHARGLTPNPCIRCNRTIKFGRLLELMRTFECSALATGHYARVARERIAEGEERFVLLEAEDPRKDQSYYLYGLTQDQLAHAMFPLGAMRKADVFALAAHFGVPFEEDAYRESQDLCFFPEKTPQEFLKRHLRDAIRPGAIIRLDGTIVGRHEGLPLYTLGQRRGLRIGGQQIPLEVVRKDSAENSLLVAPQGAVRSQEISLHDLRFVSWVPEEHEPVSFECRTRSLGTRFSGTLTRSGDRGMFRFERPRGPEAPGQSLVLYRGREVVGGGVIQG